MQTIEDKARSIFLAALDRPPDEWPAILSQTGDGDDSVRARVDELFRAHHAMGRIAGGAADAPQSPIGPYRLLDQIGEGGFGVVYLAEQERPVRRRVALKIIKPGMDTREVISRFAAERQALALMDHPHIAKVFDAGATAAGRPYFVMELVQGVPITDYCDQCNLSTRERLELFIAVCQAVQHAHQKGVIHRDLKPTNILVAMQEGKATPKIIDFGVAKAIGDVPLTERTLTTAFAQMVGTPMYMSPEQAELSPLGVDTRSDIYSLGVLLYELLTGATPFDEDRLHEASYDELRRIIREEEPPRPSVRISTLAADLATTIAERRRTDARRLRQTIGGELDWIVMKCLEKDRNRRYESAGSLAKDIERYLNDEPVQACPPSTNYRFRKFARRNKFLLGAGGAIAAALLVGLGLSLWMYLRATTESARAQAVAGLLQEAMGSADAGQVKGADYTVREQLADFSTALGDQLADQPLVEAEVRETIGRAYRSLRLPDRAQPHFEKAIELRRQHDGPRSEQLAALLVDYGWNLHDQERNVEADTQLQEALAIYRQRGVTGEPFIHALHILQHVLISLGRDADAERVTQQALAVARNNGEEYADLAGLLHRYADLKNKQGRYAEGEQLAMLHAHLAV
jgi:serine/threonine protein kinase/Tfp pilus assembly protein PilF